ncbi:MAG: sulfotransferase family 2 domain-containing protein [Planctomycetota bacterium]
MSTFSSSAPRGDRAVIFLHVPKTAGSTLRRILQRQFEPGATHRLYGNHPEELFAHFKTLPEVTRLQIQLLLGHFDFGMHQHLASPATYVAVTRQPVERIISDYHYIRNNPGHVFHQTLMEANMGLREFVECGEWKFNDNAMVRMFAGMLDAPWGSLDEETLERAKNNIRDHFSLVGLTEKFDEALVLLARQFGWRSLYYERENVAVKKPPAATIPEDTVSGITRVNALDVDLYQFVADRFEQETEREGSGFQDAVREFVRVNGELRTLIHDAHELIMEQDFVGALSTLDRAFAVAPEMAMVHHQRSAACFHLGDMDDALAHAAVALRLDPYDRRVILHCGHLLDSQGRPGQARALYRFYLRQQDPYDAEILGKLDAPEGECGEGLRRMLSSCARLGP